MYERKGNRRKKRRPKLGFRFFVSNGVVLKKYRWKSKKKE
jgi:hypothetical protein